MRKRAPELERGVQGGWCRERKAARTDTGSMRADAKDGRAGGVPLINSLEFFINSFNSCRGKRGVFFVHLSMSIRIVLFRHWIVSHRCGGNTAYIKQIFCCAIMDLRRMSYYHPAALILIRIWILNVIGRWDIWSYFQ